METTLKDAILKINFNTKPGIMIPKGAKVEIITDEMTNNYVMVKYKGMYLPVHKDALEEVES